MCNFSYEKKILKTLVKHFLLMYCCMINSNELAVREFHSVADKSEIFEYISCNLSFKKASKNASQTLFANVWLYH